MDPLPHTIQCRHVLAHLWWRKTGKTCSLPHRNVSARNIAQYSGVKNCKKHSFWLANILLVIFCRFLMLSKCWEHRPEERPSFKELVETLSEYWDDIFYLPRRPYSSIIATWKLSDHFVVAILCLVFCLLSYWIDPLSQCVHLALGPDKLCWHFFEHYRYLEALSSIWEL